ncbi:MAG TPA: peptidylprolyl isomerase [Candidatus Binatia bacterium]|nr:peptidylprolyl isomerase [Candidatus Binatia bacterium]
MPHEGESRVAPVTHFAVRRAAVAARLPRLLLVTGLLSGIGAAALGLRPPPELPDGAVAVVNGQPILRDAWLRAVAAVASERREPLTAADQRHILDRLVDEELLVQRALALGLAERNGRVRSVLVQEAMIAAGGAVAAPLDDAALRRFYDEHRAQFAPAPSLRVRAWRVASDGARSPFQPAVPRGSLPAATLRNYLGPQLTARAQAAEPGTAVTSPDGTAVVEVLERVPSAAPPYEAVRAEVLAEARRRADEDAVRALLAELRRGAALRLAPGLP